MPQMQWLGTLPTKPSKFSQLADAMKGGAKNWAGIQQQKTETGMKQQYIDMNLEKMDYNKKKDVANMVTSAVKSMDNDRASQFLDEPEVKALFEDLDWPIPKGMSDQKSLKDQAVESISIGEPLPGMSMDETKKAAGILIEDASDRGYKITGSDVSTGREDIDQLYPLSAVGKLMEFLGGPGANTSQGRKREELKEKISRRHLNQLLGEDATIKDSGMRDPFGIFTK